MITFDCASCGRKLKVQEALAGKRVQCGHCRQVAAVPAELTLSAANNAEERTLPPRNTSGADLPPPSPRSEAETIAPSPGQQRSTAEAGPASADAADSTAADETGQRGEALPAIPGFEVLGVLGRGGMGVVYKARQAGLKRLVALKMILSGAYAGEGERSRFLREAEAVARLHHPHIVQIHQIGEHDGNPFFSLEYCDGGSLAGLLGGTPLPAEEAAHVVRLLAGAMQSAHDQNIIHRDLKPANVLLGRAEMRKHPGVDAPRLADFVPKITDFGLARQLDEVGQTASGAIMGTPSYMAPEQAGGDTKTHGPAADVYALGAILYECLTGRPPFKGANSLETIMMVVSNEPVPPGQLNAKTPRDLETICLKCLRKEPGKRYKNALALAEDLRRFQAGEPIAARPVGQLERGWLWCRRNPIVGGLSAAVVLILVAGLIVSSGLAAWALGEKDRADSQAIQAENNAKDARTKEKQVRDEKHRADANAADARHAKIEADLKADEARRAKIDADLKAEEARRSDELAREQVKQKEHQLSLAELRLYSSKLAQSQFEWQNDNGPKARQLLDECQWNLRGIEFRHLWTLYHSNMQSFHGHSVGPSCVAFAPNGKSFASGSGFNTFSSRPPPGESGEVILWDPDTGKHIVSVNWRGNPLSCIAYSPDSKYIVFGGDHQNGPGELRVLDIEAKKILFTLKGHTSAVRCVAYSPDGKRIVSASAESKGNSSQLKLWDSATGKEIASLEKQTGQIRGLMFRADGKRILSANLSEGKNVGGTFVNIWDPDADDEGQETVKLNMSNWGRGRAAGPRASFVQCVAFSPDGRRIAAGSSNGSLSVWNTDKGAETLFIKAHPYYLRCLAFSADGKLLVTGGEDETVKVWDAINGQALFSLQGHFGPVWCAAFSPDGKRLVSGSKDRSLNLWNAHRGQQILSLKGHTGRVSSVAFSPDSTRFVSTGVDGTVYVWDPVKGEQILSPRTGLSFQGTISNSSYYGAAYSPDGRHIIAGTKGEIHVWDALKGKRVRDLVGHTDQVHCVAFSPDGKRIASGSWDKTIKIWDFDKGEEICTLRGHTGRVEGLAFSPDGKRLLSSSGSRFSRGDVGELKLWNAATGTEILSVKANGLCAAFSPDGKWFVGGGDHMLKIWDAVTAQEIVTLKGHSLPVLCVAITSDGKRIISGSGDLNLRGEVKVWDVHTGQDFFSLKGHNGPVDCLAISPDGKHIVAGSDNWMLWVWDADMHRDVLLLDGHTQAACCVAYSADGQRIVSGSEDRLVKIWDAAKGQEILSLKGHSEPVRCLALSADRIVSGSVHPNGDGDLKLWNAATGQELFALHGHTAAIECLAYSPDGKRFVSGSADHTLRVWDPVQGQALLTLKGHAGPVLCAAYSPDGKCIVSGSADLTLKVWDAVQGKELFCLKGHVGAVESVAYHPDGRRIVSGSADAMLKVWDADTGNEITTLQGHTASVHSVAYSPDGKRILSGGEDTRVKLWDPGRELLLLSIQGSDTSVKGVCFCPNGKRIVVASDSARLRVLEIDLHPRLLQAMTQETEGVSLLPKLDAGGWFKLGTALRAQNKNSAAVIAFEKSVELDPKQSLAFYNLGLSHAEQNNLTEAIAAYRKAIDIAPTFPEANCNLGHVLKRSGEFAQALKFMRRGHELGSKLAGWRYPSAAWVKHCEQLVELDKRLLPVLAKTEPASPADLLALAQMCQFFKKHFAASALLYQRALAGLPDLAEGSDRQHRYNAACAATLAGCEQGNDVRELSNEDKANLRQQARAWLRADLDLFAKQLKIAIPMTTWQTEQMLLHWHKDADLAGCRDAAALAKLPAEESKLWQALWQDAAGLLSDARGNFTQTRFDGKLTAKIKQHVHYHKLLAGRTYFVDLESSHFDTLLKLEDAKGKLLAHNDDISADNHNSRLIFTPDEDGFYRLVATSFPEAGIGTYTLTVREFTATKP